MRILGGLVTLIFGLICLVSAYHLNTGSLSKPDSGFWPFCVSFTVVLLSVFVIIKDSKTGTYEAFTSNTKKVIYCLLSIIVFVIIFKTIGLLVATPALLLFHLRFLGGEPWRLTVILSIGITIVTYALFSVWFNIPFPGYLS